MNKKSAKQLSEDQKSTPFRKDNIQNAVNSNARDNEEELPLISCVMPTYGRPAYVNEAIQMFLDQDYPNKELIILNDCEGQIFTCNLPPEAGIQVINHPERFPNLGDKRNACIEIAKGEFIAIWDDDDVYLPWRLSYSYRMLKAYDTPFYRAKDFLTYWGKDEPLHNDQSVPGWVSHPNTLFTKDLWKKVQGYPSIDVGEDSQFFSKIHQLLEQEFITYPIDRMDRFFILRAKSDYPHMCMDGGSGELETDAGNIELQPRPIADPLLQCRYHELVQHHQQSTASAGMAPDSESPVLSVCVGVKNRSAVSYGNKTLKLFPNMVKSLVQAAENIDGIIELVVADFGSNDHPPGDWLYKQGEGLSVKLLQLDGDFSRGRGLNEAARHSRSNRLLLTDADVLVNEAALLRAIDLIDQDQAWFPIFHCFNEEGQLEHWLDLGYGIVGLARSVFDASGGVPEFESWGGEDDIFSERVQTQVPGVRERFGGLRHQWHPDHCRHENYRNTVKADYLAHVSSADTDKLAELSKTHGKHVVFNANHPDWSGPLHFYENGHFTRPGLDTGSFEINEDQSLILRWDRWPEERLLWNSADDSYHCVDNLFTIQPQK